MEQSGVKWVIKMFMGEYHHTIDSKGRLIIPSKIRDDLGNSFFMTRGLEGCLYVYPKSNWENIIAKYKEIPDTKDKRYFMRIFLSGATNCELDSQGRVNIPTPLLDYAKLEKECLIIGVDDRLEIWSKDEWDIFINTNENKLSDLADTLFTIN